MLLVFVETSSVKPAACCPQTILQTKFCFISIFLPLSFSFTGIASQFKKHSSNCKCGENPAIITS